MHNGAPTHFSLIARNYLDRVFPQRWIGNGGSLAWSARSLDFTPLDFFLWGHLKSLVYEIPVQTEVELRQRIIHARETIR
jgi:hypothetical protein